jgi:hypothetical protein
VLPILNGGSRRCNSSSYTCSVGTKLLRVVFVAGLTSYWYYGFRRALLLSRHRRTVLARLARDRVADEALAHDSVHAIAATALSRYRDWRSQPPAAWAGDGDRRAPWARPALRGWHWLTRSVTTIKVAVPWCIHVC